MLLIEYPFSKQKLLPAFSFGIRGAKEKANKKKSAEEKISPRARGDKGFAPLTAQAFEKA